MLRFQIAVVLMMVLLGRAICADEVASSQTGMNPLRQRVSLAFDAMPITDAAAKIASTTGLQVEVDEEGVRQSGRTLSQTLLVINLVNVPLADALDAALRPLQLGYTFADGTLTITSEERATPLLTTVYPIADLVSVAGGDSTPSTIIDPAELERMAAFLRSAVDPQSWKVTPQHMPPSGRGVITVDETTASLIIRQTADVHARLGETLRALRHQNEVQVVAEVKVLALAAADYFNNIDKLLPSYTLTPAELQSWRMGTGDWSRALILSWATVTLQDGGAYTMKANEDSLRVTLKTTVSMDRRSVITQVGTATDIQSNQLANVQNVIIADHETTFIPLRMGRLPLVDESGFAYIVVVTPKIQIAEEEEELLSETRP